MLRKVRRALHVADSIHSDGSEAAERLLAAAERYREAQVELSILVNQTRPATAAGAEARKELLHDLQDRDRQGELLKQMLEDEAAPEADILTPTPPSQVQ